MDIFDRIRAACASVAAGSTHVRIEYDHLERYASELSGESAPSDPGRAPLDGHEATAAFVISMDAINFGSGYFPYLRKRPGLSGYYTVASGFREFAEAEGPLTASTLAGLSTGDVATMLDQPLDDPVRAELMGLFSKALQALGNHVERHHGGSFLELVGSARGSAAALVAELDTIAYYRDVATWRGQPVPLYKRAQITVFDLAEAFGHRGPGAFEDLDRLTMFADNLVPHVLRHDGVLWFADDLVALIDRGIDIGAGSEPEVEIRACGVHAVELLVEAMGAEGVDCCAARLDGLLWHRGSGPEYKSRPRHRARTTAY